MYLWGATIFWKEALVKGVEDNTVTNSYLMGSLNYIDSIT